MVNEMTKLLVATSSCMFEGFSHYPLANLLGLGGDNDRSDLILVCAALCLSKFNVKAFTTAAAVASGG